MGAPKPPFNGQLAAWAEEKRTWRVKFGAGCQNYAPRVSHKSAMEIIAIEALRDIYPAAA
jgi:hypothetical protein